MFSAIRDGIIPSLNHRPPDIETLRLYILLPECSIYGKVECYKAVVIPFSEAILRLSTEAARVLSKYRIVVIDTVLI